MRCESSSMMWLKTLLIVMLAGTMAPALTAASPATPGGSHTYCFGCCDAEPVDCKATAAACKRICAAAALFGGPQLTVSATHMTLEGTDRTGMYLFSGMPDVPPPRMAAIPFMQVSIFMEN